MSAIVRAEQSISAAGTGAEGERLAQALTILLSDIADKKLRLTSPKLSHDGASLSDIISLPNLGVSQGGHTKVTLVAAAVILGATVVLIFLVEFFARAKQSP